METKASLNAQLAAAKKAGKSMQTIGRIQYKLNQLNKDPKGTAVKTKTGVVKSKTGVVRQTDSSKKVRKTVVKKMPMDRNPNTVSKAAPKKVTGNSGSKVKTITGNSGSKRPMSSTKKVTPNSGSKGNIQPVKLNKITLASAEANRKSKQQKQEQIQAANNASIAAANKAAANKAAVKKVVKKPKGTKITLASAEANRKSKQQKQEQIQAANNASIAAAKKKAVKKVVKKPKGKGTGIVKSTAQSFAAPHAKITSVPYTTAELQTEFNRFNKQHRKNLGAIKAAKKEAKRQNDSIDRMASKADEEMRANKKKTDRLKKQAAQEKIRAANKKTFASVRSSRKTGNYSGL